MEEAVSPWLVSKDDDDIVSLFLNQLANWDDVKVMDFSCHGYVSAKIGMITRRRNLNPDQLTVISSWDKETSKDVIVKSLELADIETLTFAVGSIDSEGVWPVGWSFNGSIQAETLSLPNRYIKAGSERLLNFQSEMTLVHWLKQFQSEIRH